MKISTTKLLLASLVFILVLGGVGYLRPRWFGLYATPRVNSMHPLWEINPRDKRELLGIAHNAFVGKVLSSNGIIYRQTSGPLPTEETSFNIEVQYNIKGQLQDTIVVNQMGSFDERTNTYHVMENDQILQLGMTYLFVTRTDQKGRHLLISKYGDIPLPNEQERERVVKEFEEALKNEISHIREDGTNDGVPYIQQQ